MGMTVGEVAALASVSVRTLHHYDEIGLLSPSERSEGGYRVYDDGDLAALQQILFFKELGFGLAEIGRIIHDPTFDRLEALRVQRRMLHDKAAQLALMVEAVDAAIDATEGGISLDADDMFEVFGDFNPKQYEEEARQRWGGTAAYAESARRTERYTKQDWLEVKTESEAIEAAFATLMDEGVLPGDPRAMDVAERHRLQVDRRFYPCSSEMHVGLAGMYVADPRFAKHYDDRRPGLARYVCDAVKANATRTR
jgi:DNA-binding transcriptional MerR regulator